VAEQLAQLQRIHSIVRMIGENPNEKPNKLNRKESPLISLLLTDYRLFMKAVHDFGHKNACPAEES
jgi:hypothetical protein